MATLEEIREVDSFGVEYIDSTREKGYRFVRDARAVVIERTKETDFRFVADRKITPFTDVANSYDLVGEGSGGKPEFDRRRRTLARNTDQWLEGLGLRTDRIDAHRCWTDETVPHLICRYSDEFQKHINGSRWEAPARFAAVGLGFASGPGIALIGNVVTEDTAEELAEPCVDRGFGLSEYNIESVDSRWFLIMDLDGPAMPEGSFSAFSAALEETFRLW